MVIHPFVVFLCGLLILISGAELLLRSATKFADMLGMSPVVIGLTIVALGTSVPELAIGITAATEGKGVLSVGNIVGANMVNILCILGMAALIRPMSLSQMYLKLDLVVMIMASSLLLLMSMDGRLMPWEGALLVLSAVIYTIVILRTIGRRRSAETAGISGEPQAAHAPRPTGWPVACWYAALLLIGITITLLGSDLLVSGAVELAQILGVSDGLIGLTIVALGTTTPELATTLLGIIRNKRNVVVGTLVGSFIYNILIILGVTVITSQTGIGLEKNMQWLDLPFMVVVALGCAYACRSGHHLSRGEGAIFLMVYILYMGPLVVFRT